MNSLQAPSLQSLMDSDRGSNDSLLAESLQLDLDEVNFQRTYSDFFALHTYFTACLCFHVCWIFFFFSGAVAGRCRILHSTCWYDAITRKYFKWVGRWFRCNIGCKCSHYTNTIHRWTTKNWNNATSCSTTGCDISNSICIGKCCKWEIKWKTQSDVCSMWQLQERINSGLATSVAVSDMIAIGTSHGHIMAFDILQTLRWCCQEYLQQGAVSSLAFNEESTRLLAGFARGYIVMIDTTTGDSIRVLTDAITPNSGVLNLKWTGKPTLALCSDTGGSVWSLSFTRRLGKRGCDSKCLFSGARGEVSY